jgi:hypothetical protein
VRYKRAEGPRIQSGEECAAPDCHEMLGLEAHHIFSRGQMGKTDWVLDTETGEVIPNIAWLCSFHHREVTENRARIYYDSYGEKWEYRWHELQGQDTSLRTWPNYRYEVAWHDVGPLNGVLASVPLAALSDSDGSLSEGGDSVTEPPGPLGARKLAGSGADARESSSSENDHDCSAECITCGTPITRKRRKKSESKGRRKSWAIWVPKDVEDGAEALDNYMAAVRVLVGPEMGYDDKTPDYYFICAALASFIQSEARAA